MLLYCHMGQPVKASDSLARKPMQKPRRHRGADPEDERSFGADRLVIANQAPAACVVDLGSAEQASVPGS